MAKNTELDRVSNKIKNLIIEFLRRVGKNNRFHMHDLQQYVCVRTSAAPDSPSRVLRSLKSSKAVKYKLISRAGSLYEFLGL